MDRSAFIRGLLDDPRDPQLPQSVPQNDFGPRAYGLLNALFPDPYEAAGEAVQQFRAGNPIDAFVTMYGAMPATGALKSVPKAAKAAEAVSEAAPAGIVAYHGSPHSFDRFDMSKIGTGEGAQAYGHGLYFADNEDVAKAYRDALAPADEMSANGRRLSQMPEHERHVFDYLHKTGGSPAEASAYFAKKGKEENELIATVRDLLGEDIGGGNSYVKYVDFANSLTGRPEFAPAGKGSMYQVRINADPEHFLDWDKPLSEQSEAVRAALTPEGLGLKPSGPHGEKGYYGWTDNNERLVGRATTGSVPPNAFNDKELGFNLYKGTGSWSPQEGTERLRAAGIPGIKYLDQGSRVAGEGSRNYVVFDDSLIEILKKYGLIGLLGSGAAMGASQPPNAPQGAPLL